MDQLIAEIETYCAAKGMTPNRLLRIVLNAKWSAWDEWKARSASPTMVNADRLRAYMAEHPATVCVPEQKGAA